MAKYRLSYFDGIVTKPIKLEKLDCLKGKDVTTLEVIDSFIATFNNKDELLDFLKENNILDEEVKKVFVTKELKDKEIKNRVYQERLYNGDYLFYKEDYCLLNISEIKKFIRVNAKNGRIIKIIADNYLKKYQKGPSSIRGVLETLRGLSNVIAAKGISAISYSDEVEYNKCIENFITFEFNKYDYNPYTRDFIRKRDNNGKSIKNYSNIRKFSLLLLTNPELKNLFKSGIELNIKSNLEVFDNSVAKYKNSSRTDDEHEEFLTKEDFDLINKQILTSYKDTDSSYVEGEHEHIRPLTKKELKQSLEEIKEAYIRANDDIGFSKKMK